MSSRSDRNIETRKKKARRSLPRPKQTRIQGNTAGARTKLRKQALQRAGSGEAGAAASQ
jgi:hypothetical protein